MGASMSVLEERVPPFRKLHRGEQVMLAVSIAAGEMGSRIEAILRDREPILSHARYNALRILRGSSDTGLSCTEIGERLLLAPPDVTRLIDPLVRLGLVSRAPNPTDRRVVLQRLTPEGSELLAELDRELATIYRAIIQGLGSELANELVEACERFIEVARTMDDSSARVAVVGAAG